VSSCEKRSECRGGEDDHGSTRMTVEAAVRLSPTPPALRDCQVPKGGGLDYFNEINKILVSESSWKT
jgi:hypothetical protein